MPSKEEKESWNRYQKVVLSEIANHTKALECVVASLKELSTSANGIKVEMASMKVTIESLKDNEERICALEEKQTEMNRELGESKISAGLWGSISGALTAIAGGIFYFMTGGK